MSITNHLASSIVSVISPSIVMYKIWYTCLVLCGIAVVIADPATFSVGDIGQYDGSAVSLGVKTANYMPLMSRKLINVLDKHPHNNRQCH